MDLPLHPKLVHLPIALAVLMPLISFGLLAAWWRGALSRRTWAIAVALQLVLVGSGLAAIDTGGDEEERVEAVVPEAAIEAHEEAAEVFEVAAAVVLLLALLGGVVPRERLARGFAAAASAGTLVVLVLGYRVGEAGGRLVYEHGAASAYAPRDPGALPSPRGDEDDDGD